MQLQLCDILMPFLPQFYSIYWHFNRIFPVCLHLGLIDNGITLQVFGFLTRPLVKYLLPHPQHATNNSCREPKSPNEDMNLPLLSFDESTATNLLRAKDSLSMLLDRPVYTIHSFWRRFDDTYMRPVFGGPDSNQSQC